MNSSFPNRFSVLERNTDRKRLGQLLVNWRVLNKDHIENALSIQTASKKPVLLGEVLIEMGLVTENNIINALSFQYQIPFIPVSMYKIDTNVLDLLPMEIAVKYNVIPLERSGNCLILSTSNPLDYKALQIVEDFSGCRIQLVLSTHLEISKAIEKYYGKNDPENARAIIRQLG